MFNVLTCFALGITGQAGAEAGPSGHILMFCYDCITELLMVLSWQIFFFSCILGYSVNFRCLLNKGLI